MASKVKRAKTAQGMSHTEGKISNKMDFRNSSSEIFLLDSGAGVNIISEDIANNLKVKIYKLKQKRFVTEASGNMLNIIGSVEIFVQIPFVKSTKKLEFLVLRGASIDREILVSCDTLMKWDLIHDTFGRETVTDYVYRNNVTHYNSSNSKIIRNKCKISTQCLSYIIKQTFLLTIYWKKFQQNVSNLGEKILKIHKRNFKEKLGPKD